MSEPITRAEAVEAAQAWLKKNVGKKDLAMPKTWKGKVSRVVRDPDDEQGIAVVFGHQDDASEPAILAHAQKCIEALKVACPEVAPFKFRVLTLRY